MTEIPQQQSELDLAAICGFEDIGGNRIRAPNTVQPLRTAEGDTTTKSVDVSLGGPKGLDP